MREPWFPCGRNTIGLEPIRRIEFADPRAGFARRISIRLYRPRVLAPLRPMVIVLHGMSRDAGAYCDAWADSADRHGFAVVAPEFSVADYPDTLDYNFGNMISPEGRLLPRAQWLFPVIDQIFLRARDELELDGQRYCLYGHSAGAQLVHRCVTFAWSARIALAISANAGSYTMPLFDVDYPFGLRGTAFTERDMPQLLSRPLVVMLGDEDNDAAHPSLPRQPEAMKQGPHRFARGQRYVQTAVRIAAELQVPLSWKMITVPGVAHSNPGMAPAAAALCASISA
jgi:poly(3-hydroxybutyrate) depolymerase